MNTSVYSFSVVACNSIMPAVDKLPSRLFSLNN